MTSWVIREKDTCRVIAETFNKGLVDCLNTSRYEAVSIIQHLGDINRSIREENGVRVPVYHPVSSGCVTR